MTEVIAAPTNYLNNGPMYNDEDCKLFVGGLSLDTTENDLFSYFEQFGSIKDVTIKYNQNTGHHRGFGFVTFASDSSISAVLDNGPHSLRNKQIDPRKAKTRPTCKKIFVGGLNSNIQEEEICSYFNQYGKVEGVELPFDFTRNRRREFCFVIFEDEESADKACAQPRQNVGGREVDIKKAQPQSVQKQFQRRNNNHYQNNFMNNNLMNYNQNDYDYGNNWSDNRNKGNGGGGYRNNNSNNNYMKRPQKMFGNNNQAMYGNEEYQPRFN